MQIQQPTIWQRLVPYIGIGIFLVIMIIAIVLFSYILLMGAIIGSVLFAIAWFRMRFFPSKRNEISRQSQGKTYEHKMR